MSDVARRGPGDRAGLDRDRILTAARQLPPESITMQAVADRLGVTRKALSHHVTDRDTLLGLVAMETFGSRFTELRVDPTAHWREVCTGFAAAVVAGALAAGPLAERVHLDPGAADALVTTEAVISALVDAGCTDESALRTVVLLTTISLGHARDVAAAQRGDRERPAELRVALGAAAVRYPVLDRIAQAGLDTYGSEQLQFSVDLVLDGLAARLGRT